MITPIFNIEQDDLFVVIAIKAPYCKVSEAEFFIEDYSFKFYAKPYYLRINLPGAIVEDGRESAKYDYDTGYFTVKVAKQSKGTSFEGLDMLTKLLAPVSSQSPDVGGLVEVLDCDDSIEATEEEFDWQIEQVPYAEPELSIEGPKYGFANQKFGVFSRLQEDLLDLIDLKNADLIPCHQRKGLREDDEKQHFSEDHYMADFIDEEGIMNEVLNYKPNWEKHISASKSKQDSDLFTEEEKEKLLKLPRKQYLLDKNEQQICLLSLVDILFAFVYNHIVTEGENNVESAWNICKLSSTLSWLDIPVSLESTVTTSFRRSLCYPLYRHWELAQKTFKGVCDILSLGRGRILKSLLEVHNILSESDPCYILNDVYITDYCVWIQSVGEKPLKSLLEHLKQINVKKMDIGFEIDVIEQACHLAQEEQNEENFIGDQFQLLQLNDAKALEQSDVSDNESDTSGSDVLTSTSETEYTSESEAEEPSALNDCDSRVYQTENFETITRTETNSLDTKCDDIVSEKTKSDNSRTIDNNSLNF